MLAVQAGYKTGYTSRPGTSGMKGVPPRQKKNDPVSRYQNLRNEWSKSTFLKKHGPQGRKLELDRFNQWRKLADDENKRTKL